MYSVVSNSIFGCIAICCVYPVMDILFKNFVRFAKIEIHYTVHSYSYYCIKLYNYLLLIVCIYVSIKYHVKVRSYS